MSVVIRPHTFLPDESENARSDQHAATPSSDRAAMPFDRAAGLVLETLQRAMTELFAAAPSEIRKAADVERVFGVNHLLGWQIYRIATAANPLAAGLHVPARVSMKKLFAAAARRGVSSAVIENVSSAFESFERLVESDAGDRDELLAMLNAFLPEERAKHQLANKQAAFKAMSQLKGVANEVDYSAVFYHPSTLPNKGHVVAVMCEFGLRRFHADARIVLGTGALDLPELTRHTLTGDPITHPTAAILPQFSTNPLPRVDSHHIGTMVYHFVADQDIGMRSAIDLVSAELFRDNVTMHWTPDQGSSPFRGPTYTTDTPVKRLTCDVFLHRDFFPGVTPALWVYDTACRGWVRGFNDPARDHDRFHILETIRPLPTGLAAIRLHHVPRHIELLEHVYATQNWDPQLFRGFRLDVHYPIYGAQYMIGFRLPGFPDEASPPPASKR